MKILLILSVLLSFAMLYLGISKHISYAVFFAVVLLLTTFKFILDILGGRKKNDDEKQ